MVSDAGSWVGSPPAAGSAAVSAAAAAPSGAAAGAELSLPGFVVADSLSCVMMSS